MIGNFLRTGEVAFSYLFAYLSRTSGIQVPCQTINLLASSMYNCLCCNSKYLFAVQLPALGSSLSSTNKHLHKPVNYRYYNPFVGNPIQVNQTVKTVHPLIGSRLGAIPQCRRTNRGRPHTFTSKFQEKRERPFFTKEGGKDVDYRK